MNLHELHYMNYNIYMILFDQILNSQSYKLLCIVGLSSTGIFSDCRGNRVLICHQHHFFLPQRGDVVQHRSCTNDDTDIFRMHFTTEAVEPCKSTKNRLLVLFHKTHLFRSQVCLEAILNHKHVSVTQNHLGSHP